MFVLVSHFSDVIFRMKLSSSYDLIAKNNVHVHVILSLSSL